MELPIKILDLVNGLSYVIDDVGCSDDSVIIFEDKYILKISKDVSRLQREMFKTDWLYGKIPSAKSVMFVEENGKAYYLRTYLNGVSLIDERYLNDPLKLIKLIKKAVDLLRVLDKYDCPFFSNESSGDNFIHGDLCLPNILTRNDEIIGLIDLDSSGLGDRWFDYAWLLWSFEYNLNTDYYNEQLLNELGIKMDLKKYLAYIPKENIEQLKNR